MKRIKSDVVIHHPNGIYISYTVNGKEYWCQGQFHFDGERHHHVHVGPRGGEYDVVFK